MEAHPITQAVKEVVNRMYPKNEVTLFGSRARGDARPDSDWDFLILIDKNVLTSSEKQMLRNELYAIELDTGEIITALIRTRIDWVNRSVTPIYQRIEKEGIAV